MFYTQQRGTADRPSLLLIHGAGGTHLDWPAALRRLPNTAVYTLDLPGHGRSAPPACDTVAAYADRVADLLTDLRLSQVVLLGHSMGGAIALELGLRRLPALRGLVIVGSGARLPVSDAILQQALADFDAATAFITQHTWAAHVPAEARQQALARLRQTPPEVLHADFLACNRFDVRGRLAEIPVPALVIGAAQDKMAPPKFSQFLADHLPRAELLLLPDTGHMIPLEQPAAVATAVGRFVNQL